MEMALLGEKLSAEDAKAAGLINRVVDDAEVLATAQAIAAKLAAGPGKAIGLIRTQMNAAVQGTLDEVLTIERDNQRVLGYSEDFKESLAAFAEKRKPQFKGR
jgi:2-(1,2-epoxy-1,2-dihydrophenyl)acetyl-CoA isomerase